MTFVSVAQAAHRLGIDAKTLHRWLAHAQTPLQSHPQDARKKGVRQEDLQALARLHQRSLALLAEEPPAPAPDKLPEGSAAKLSLPNQLSALQAQIAALQQQVAELTGLITQRQPELAIPLAPSVPSRTAKPLPKPTPSAPRSRPAAKAPRKPVHVIARVEYGPDGRYVLICPKQGVLPFAPDSPEWFAWLAQQDSFRFVGHGGHFTAHHWWRVPRGAWRAHRQIRNHSFNVRLAPTQELTLAVLEQAAEALQAHLK